ncbi:MAG: cbb3-type cytochrome c oxidase subunit I [Verrucomicrobiales bacterium]|nr:cbb3-type cytochrome c oxidase subunit I [Verrucomicrobiales bacterium]
MSAAATAHGDESHDHDHGHEHHEVSWIRKYVFSTDHKVIGIQYGISGLIFLAIGFILMLAMRHSIAHTGQPLPDWIRTLLGVLGPDFLERWAPNGVMDGQLYNMFGAMHGTIMVFFGVVPLGVACFGNFVMPLQIGAPDMAFPRLNMWSYWLFFISGVLMFGSFFVHEGAAQSGWTNYSPLASTVGAHSANQWWHGQTIWLLAMVFNISASLLGAVNFITTVMNLRAKGMTWMRVPFFSWAMMVIAFLLLLAFPPLEVAALLQLSDRVFGSSFYLPSGLFVQGQHMDLSGGGSPLLYQHLFWFLAHPEVYVLILPGIAICAEIIPANTRRPLWGYKSMVGAVLVLGFLSFIVWAHHMYMTGMGQTISTFFQFTTVIISVPSVILLTCLMISLWGGSIRFTVPMLWATAFLPMFGIGGLTGIPLAFNLVDLFLHDTLYVIGHFHYVVAPGTIFAMFAGIYHWFPKATGRHMNTLLGHLHFWPSLLAMNLIFGPMFIQGMAGFHRRWYNGGLGFPATSEKYLYLNDVMTWGAYLLAAGQIPFIINFFASIFAGRKVKSDNPWHATTLEWATPTPPPHGNFTTEPVANRSPYEYSSPHNPDEDFLPQWAPLTEGEKSAAAPAAVHAGAH